MDALQKVPLDVQTAWAGALAQSEARNTQFIGLIADGNRCSDEARALQRRHRR